MAVGRRFGENLVEMPGRAGLSQIGTAERAGLNRTEINLLEHGRRGTGTVTEATDSLIALRMDVPLPGAEPWDNEVCWTSDDIEAADQTVAAVFYEDVEIIGGRR